MVSIFNILFIIEMKMRNRMSDIYTRVEDKMACVIMEDIHSATFHLEHHVTRDEIILELEPNCEYCQVYLDEQKILLK
jgi:hypothetical protein